MNQPYVPPPPSPAEKSGFPTWLKFTLIGCGGLLLVALLAFAGFAWWVSRNADRLKSSMDSVVQEGEAAGRGTDQDGCIALAMEQGGGGFTAAMRITPFLEGCLRSARETPGFCADVPGPGEFRRAIAYQNEQCRGSGGAACPSVMQAKIQYCARHGSELGSPGDAGPADPGAEPAAGDTAGGW